MDRYRVYRLDRRDGRRPTPWQRSFASQGTDHSVTVRGLAERDFSACPETWTISYSSASTDISSARAKVRRDKQAIENFFSELGFPEDALQPTGAKVSSHTRNGVTRYTGRQRLALRTYDIERARKAVARQFDLVSRGVFLEEGSVMSFTLTGLDHIKLDMVAEATKDALASAEQFAKDSGANPDGIRGATQGNFQLRHAMAKRRLGRERHPL